ncbi:hypothetical protein D3C80_1666540 [compost metagenome]
MGQDFQLGHQTGRTRGVDRRAGPLRGGDMVGQDVRGAQQGLDGDVVAFLTARSQLVHQGLEDMSEANQIFQTKGPCPAFDRVDGAEDGVDRLGVALAGFQRQQIGFQIAQQFAALLEEGDLDGLERIVAHLGVLRPRRDGRRRPAWPGRRV